MTRLEYYIRNSKPIVFVSNWLKQVYLPGFEGVSLFDSLSFFQKQIFSSRFNYSASAVSFSFLMALPPLLLFFFTLIPYLPLPEKQILEVLNNMMLLMTPNENMQRSVNKLISDFITHKKMHFFLFRLC
ncbi:MAG: ribonuclease BN [Bacteroidetes bacterium OLB11]|nr:MAG: ribonuclease BN [Bacteroidetes bacterium OLB11]